MPKLIDSNKKRIILIVLLQCLLIFLAAFVRIPTQTVTLTDVSPALQQTGTTTQEPYPAPTEPVPPGEEAFQRPLVVLNSYSPADVDIAPGKQFTLEVSLINKGQQRATNIVAAITGVDFFPGETGGIVSIGHLDPDQKKKFTQPLTTAFDIWSKYVVTVEVTVSYTDPGGIAYQEHFVISYPIDWGKIIVATSTPASTTTPTPFLRPQLVITTYQTDLDQLIPGGQFTLELDVQNLGHTAARQVTMILGGGSLADGGGSETAQPPGGVSGGSGDLTNFAPLGSSNVQSLGDLAAGASLAASQDLIVNVSTEPGAYPLKVTFTYLDDNNRIFTDDQVITLLVYSPPRVEISFYRDPGILISGQPNLLPLQIVNIGKKTAILGNMQITGEAAEFSNNTTLVGSLESGGYFTLDATVIPFQAGSLTLDISVSFTDDFNQAQQIVQTLSIEVEEVPVFEPEPGGPDIPIDPDNPGTIPPVEETFWAKVARFFRGLLGLDSGISQPQPGFEEPGFEEQPPEFEGPIVPGKG